MLHTTVVICSVGVLSQAKLHTLTIWDPVFDLMAVARAPYLQYDNI
jgi:hypothetical protein